MDINMIALMKLMKTKIGLQRMLAAVLLIIANSRIQGKCLTLGDGSVVSKLRAWILSQDVQFKS